MGSYIESCVSISGTTIDGDYRDFGDSGGSYFSPDGEIFHEKNEYGHPTFILDFEEKIELEFSGFLDIEKTVAEYIHDLGLSNQNFGRD